MDESRTVNPAVINYCPKCGVPVEEYTPEGSWCERCDFWFAVCELEEL